MTHLAEVNTVIDSRKLDQQPELAATIGLARSLANQYDTLGTDFPQRSLSAYLSAVGKLQSAAQTTPRYTETGRRKYSFEK